MIVDSFWGKEQSVFKGVTPGILTTASPTTRSVWIAQTELDGLFKEQTRRTLSRGGGRDVECLWEKLVGGAEGKCD